MIQRNQQRNIQGDRCAANANLNAKEVSKRVEAVKPHWMDYYPHQLQILLFIISVMCYGDIMEIAVNIGYDLNPYLHQGISESCLSLNLLKIIG
nr:hypothetical protein [Tanacetum cinerariifolium]